jgi:hypothetical protein
MNSRIINGITVYRPTREDITSLKVGDEAPDCFNRLAPIVEIYARGDDIKGQAYICYYVVFNSATGSRISDSLKEGEIHSSVPVTSLFKRSSAVPWD